MNSLLKVAQFGRYGFKLFSEQFSLIFSGINGLLALKDIVNHKGWKLTANEHFDPVSDFSTLDVSPQLEAIRKTRTRIVVLNTIYSRDTDASQMGMLKEWVWIATDGSTNTVSLALLSRVTFNGVLVWRLKSSRVPAQKVSTIFH